MSGQISGQIWADYYGSFSFMAVLFWCKGARSMEVINTLDVGMDVIRVVCHVPVDIVGGVDIVVADV